MKLGPTPRRLFAAIGACGSLLAACGGGEQSYLPTWPALLVDHSTTATGGATAPVATHTRTLDGPTFATTKPAAIEICAMGTWIQKVSKGVGLSLKYALLEPVQGVPVSMAATTADSGHDGSVSVDQCEHYLLPNAGTYQLRALFEVRSDCACDDALSTYAVELRWIVRAQYDGI